METKTRTVVKAVLWSLIGLLSMVLVGWVLTGSFTLGSAMALINTVLGLLCYVIYERIWAHAHWGRVSKGHEDV